MKLTDLTKKRVKDFAAPVIYQRGHDYYVNGMVTELSYDPEYDILEAEVEGNYGNYDVEIELDEDGEIFADCNCPYDGYPCKHIVAVLLTFISDKTKYLHQAKKQRQNFKSMEAAIKSLPREQLVKIVISGAQKYPDFQRELMVQLAYDETVTLDSIFKSINQAFPDIQSGSFDPAETVEKLETILKSIETAKIDMKVPVYWKVVDDILNELNSYGMDEEIYEDFALNTMDKLIEIFAEHKELNVEKKKIIEKLMDYYTWHNCGIVDSIYEAALELCSEREDYLIIIEKLEEYLETVDFKSYYQGLLADLYATIDDSKSELRILESHLVYGGDYWRLAQYWIKHGDQKKALEIVCQGLERGEGRKTELYNYLQEYYRKQGDYEKLFRLLEAKIENFDLDSYQTFAQDSAYKILWNHFTKTKDYNNQVRLLELQLKHNIINTELYQSAEKTLKPDDWKQFEMRIFEQLEIAIQQKKPSTRDMKAISDGDARSILAGIYNYKKDIGKLFETVKDNDRLLAEYESKLISHYPETYLKNYDKKIRRLISMRGRENYRTAAEYAHKIKKIYLAILNQPTAWKHYIDQLKRENRNLPAMQQEFSEL